MTKLFLRNTTTNGITDSNVADIIYDMLVTAGSGVDSAITNTPSGTGVESQLTKTAGGSTIAWISGRAPAGGFTLTTTDISVWFIESNMNANVGGRYRIYKRTAAGVLTELGGGPFDDGVELGTADTEMTWTGNPTDTAFAEDDRIVVKLFLTNVGTAASGHTATAKFNAADAATGDSFFNIAETVSFKANSQTFTQSIPATATASVPAFVRVLTYVKSFAPTATAVLSLTKALTRVKSLVQTAVAELNLAPTKGVPGSGAIAFDLCSTNKVTTGSSLTYSHTCTGNNRFLLVGVSTLGGTTDRVTGVTYGGVAMTRVNTTTISTSERIYLYYLIAPASGANDVVISTNASVTIASSCASYTGAKQTSQPDANNTNNVTGGASLSVSVTTVANNSWIAAYARRNVGGAADVGANTLDRGDLNIHDFSIIERSDNPLTPAGSFAVRIDSASTSDMAICAVSFAPAAGGTTFQKALAITASVSNTLSKILTAVKTIALTASATISLTKALLYDKVLSAIASASVTLSKIATIYKTLAQTATATVLLSKVLIVVKTLAQTATAAISLSRVTTFLRTLLQDAAAVLSFTRVTTFLRTLQQDAAAVVDLAKTFIPGIIQRVLSATAEGVPSIAKVSTFLKGLTLSATAAVTIATAKLYERLLTSTANAALGIVKVVTYTRSLIATAVLLPAMSLVKRAFAKIGNALRSAWSSQPSGTSTSVKPHGTSNIDKANLG